MKLCVRKNDKARGDGVSHPRHAPIALVDEPVEPHVGMAGVPAPVSQDRADDGKAQTDDSGLGSVPQPVLIGPGGLLLLHDTLGLCIGGGLLQLGWGGLLTHLALVVTVRGDQPTEAGADSAHEQHGYTAHEGDPPKHLVQKVPVILHCLDSSCRSAIPQSSHPRKARKFCG